MSAISLSNISDISFLLFKSHYYTKSFASAKANPRQTPGFTHLKKKMREGNGVWLEEIQRP
jgi:hypothetical protein